MPSDQLPDTLPDDVDEQLLVWDDAGGVFKKERVHNFWAIVVW
jgi:hypothetical protein